MKMEEQFLEILSEAYGSDIAYHETDSTIKALLQAMQKAYDLGKSKVNNGVLDDVIVSGKDYCKIPMREFGSDKCLICGQSPITFHHFYAKGSYGHMIYEVFNGVPLCQSHHYSLHFTNRRTQIEEEIKRKRGKAWSDKLYKMSKNRQSSFKTLDWLQKQNKKLKSYL